MTAHEDRNPLLETATGRDGLLLVAINESEKSLTMTRKAGGGLWKLELHYEPQLGAVLVNARGEYRGFKVSHYGDRVAVRRTDPSGKEILKPGRGGVQDDLDNKLVCGWQVSEDFWLASLAELERHLLYAQRTAVPTEQELGLA